MSQSAAVIGEAGVDIGQTDFITMGSKKALLEGASKSKSSDRSALSSLWPLHNDYYFCWFTNWSSTWWSTFWELKSWLIWKFRFWSSRWWLFTNSWLQTVLLLWLLSKLPCLSRRIVTKEELRCLPLRWLRKGMRSAAIKFSSSSSLPMVANEIRWLSALLGFIFEVVSGRWDACISIEFVAGDGR